MHTDWEKDLWSEETLDSWIKWNWLKTQVSACENDILHTLDINFTAKLLEDSWDWDLAKTLNIFRTPSWLLIYAATDAGFNKEENHDRIVVSPNECRFSVLDWEASAWASHVLAQALLEFPNNLDKALTAAQVQLQQKRIHSATCLITAKLTPDNRLNVSQIWDCWALVFDRDGKIKFSAKDQVKLHSDTLSVDMEFLGIDRTSQKLIDTSSVTTFSWISYYPSHYDGIQLSEWDTVILFLDFLWSNFSMKELSEIVRETKEPLALFKKIADLSKRKMQSADWSMDKYDFVSYRDKFKLFYSWDFVPHVDNQSLVVFKI